MGWIGVLATVAMTVTLFLVFVVVPTEAQMGVVQRILYVHAPAAWAAYVCFFVVGGASIVYLRRRSEAADRLAVAAAEVGVLMCTLNLVTGPIWARPIWGVWWTGDPRLTMTLILWAIYVSYVVLRSVAGDEGEVGVYAAVLGISGVLAIPLVNVSARLLRGMHPAVVMNRGGGSGLVDPWMRITLLAGMIAMTLVAVWLVQVRLRVERSVREVRALRRVVEAHEGDLE